MRQLGSALWAVVPSRLARASSVRPLLRVPRRACQTHPTQQHQPPEATLWPLYAASGVAAGGLLAAVIFRRERTLRAVNESVVSASSTAALSSQGMPPLRTLLGVVVAFTLTQLPVDELKVKLLRLGALSHWGALLSLFDLDQQQVALGALVALLEGDDALQAFHENAAWYDGLVGALQPLLHATSGSLADSEILVEVLRLGAAAASHPAFVHSDDDAWVWSGLLEGSAPNLHLDPSACLPWVAIACACAEKREVALAMLRSDDVKRLLVGIADGGTVPGDGASGWDGAGGGGKGVDGWGDGRASGEAYGGVPVAEGGQWTASGWVSHSLVSPERAAALEVGYARLALHRLSAVARGHDTSGWSKEMLLEWEETFFDEYALPPEPPPRLPVRPPLEATPPEEVAVSVALSAILCAFGGAAWGLARGALPSSRAVRPVGRSVAATALAAAAFELAMVAKNAARSYVCERPPRDPADFAPPFHHRTLARYALAEVLNVGGSLALLALLVQPSRAPFAFGGWLCGRAIYLSEEMAGGGVELIYDA